MRTIIVSDVHGCYDQMIELLLKVGFDKEQDEIVFVGDLLDRGPKVYDTFKYVLNLKKEMGNKCHYIIGNHEYMFCNSNKSRDEWELWSVYNGGKVSEKDFNEHRVDIYDYVNWIEDNTELYYETENYIVCHGGVNHSIETSSIYDVVWDRNCIKYASYGGILLIVGHTPLENPCYAGIIKGEQKVEVLKYGHKYSLSDYPTGCIDIDTGCVYKGKLTAMVVDGTCFSLY